jgi:hypothetical protein
MKYIVQNGRRYQAMVLLPFLKAWVPNDMVADRFREVGFTEVDVAGSGRRRLAKGLWPKPDATAELPDEIDPGSIKEIEV